MSIKKRGSKPKTEPNTELKKEFKKVSLKKFLKKSAVGGSSMGHQAIPSVMEMAAKQLQNSVLTKLEKDPYFRTGYLYEAAGNLGAAAACYSRSIQAGPSAEAYTSLSHVLSLMGDVDAAIFQARQAVETNPEFGNGWSNLGALLIEKHVYDEAVQCLERALRSKSTTSLADTYFHLGRAYISKGLLRSATEALDKCLSYDPEAKAACYLKQQLDYQLN
jgi:tetratricopeptide (TPR) repeat protein